MNKKVYIVLYTLSVGGAERHASSIANYLVQNGYDVELILLQDNIVDYTLANGVRVTALSDLTYPDAIQNGEICFIDQLQLRTFRLISKKKYDFLEKRIYIESLYSKKLEYFFSQQENVDQSIVVSFMTIPNIIAASLKKQYKYKLIMGEFTSPQFEFDADAPENVLKRKYYPAAEGFVFQTKEQEAFYSYLTGVKKKVIPNPIEKIEVQPFRGKRKKEIVNYCKHVRAKNLPLLIEAFARLSEEYPDYRLVIYGDGPERANTEKCIVENGIADKVLLKTYAQNVLEFVRESAMFVSSSDREGISNSMLEAMAIGLPTICTDCPAGGARMLIEPYKNGILVPVRDPEAMYKAMKYMIDNPEEADRMSRNAVVIRETLEKNKILGQWLDFLRSV